MAKGTISVPLPGGFRILTAHQCAELAAEYGKSGWPITAATLLEAAAMIAAKEAAEKRAKQRRRSVLHRKRESVDVQN